MASDAIQPLSEDVQQIKHDVRAQGNILKLLLHSQATTFTDDLVGTLTQDVVMLSLLKRIDSVRTRDEIVREVIDLKLKGGGRSSTYSKFGELESLGLLLPVGGSAGRTVYRKSDVYDALRLERHKALSKALAAAA